jgi:MerR family transcriptional regulator, mercuric resistance operon regulatory protein
MTPVGLRTGQVADAAGVNRQTLRYYERRGLLAKPERSLGGHRLYPPETVTRLRSIKTAQRLGFSLAEVADLLDSTGHRPGSHTDDVGLRAGAAAKLAEVEARITELTAVAATLRDALSVGCDDLVTCARVPDCPLPFSELADDPAPPGTFRPA